jgi:hypothetical protein
MTFNPLQLRPESGANRIRSADDAYSFVAHMNVAVLNKPHWRVARQALRHAGVSADGESTAWRTFRAAAEAEGWLLENGRNG